MAVTRKTEDGSRCIGLRRTRPIVDAAMAVVYLFQMLPGKTGNPLHEIGGMLLMALFGAHHLLNRGWMGRLARRASTRSRLLLAADLALALCLVGTAATGLAMARTLPIPHPNGVAHLARPLHAWFAYVGYLLVALHVGLHLRVMAGYAHIRLGGCGLSQPVALVASLAPGIWAFVRLGVGTRLRMGVTFPDGMSPTALLVVEHLALALPCVVVGALVGSQKGVGGRGADEAGT